MRAEETFGSCTRGVGERRSGLSDCRAGRMVEPDLGELMHYVTRPGSLALALALTLALKLACWLSHWLAGSHAGSHSAALGGDCVACTGF